MPQHLTQVVTTAFALLLMLFGALLIFAPVETATFLLPAEGSPDVWFSLLGAALFGLGQMNWMARHSPIGGIYGRGLLMGNLAHFLIGGLALLKYDGGAPLPWTYVALIILYCAGALFYGALFFTSPRPSRTPTSASA